MAAFVNLIRKKLGLEPKRDTTVTGKTPNEVIINRPLGEVFDRDEFRRHMDQLRAKEELKKTNPVAAKASELAAKEHERLSSKNKKSDSSARSWWQDINGGVGPMNEAAGTNPVVFAPARMNPPTPAHRLIVDTVKKEAERLNAPHHIILTRTHDIVKKKRGAEVRNPLTPEQKIKHAQRFFPDANVQLADKSSPNLLSQLSDLHQRGHDHVVMVAGSDRIPEYKRLVDTYNGKSGPHGYYNFKKVEFKSAGERDPEAEGQSGWSATKSRQSAEGGNLDHFKKNAVPGHIKPAHAKELYDDLRGGMGLNEAWNPFKKKDTRPAVEHPKERFPNSDKANAWMSQKLAHYERHKPHELHHLFSPASGDYMPKDVHVGSSWKKEHEAHYNELKKKHPEAVAKAKEMTTGIAGRVSLSRVGPHADFHGIHNEDVGFNMGLSESILEMKNVTNRSHGGRNTIKIGGKEHTFKKYSWGAHHPVYGALKDKMFNSKAEMKSAMEKHPDYNSNLNEDVGFNMAGSGIPSIPTKSARDFLGKKSPLTNTPPPGDKGNIGMDSDLKGSNNTELFRRRAKKRAIQTGAIESYDQLTGDMNARPNAFAGTTDAIPSSRPKLKTFRQMKEGQFTDVPDEQGSPNNALDEISAKKNPCWKSHKMIGMKNKNGKSVPNCVPKEEFELEEATYQGKSVPLNTPMKGDIKKSKVYVDPDGDGKAKKVNFGDKNLSIKKNIPARKKSYCARSSGQGNLNDKSSANYWSRKAWNCEEVDYTSEHSDRFKKAFSKIRKSLKEHDIRDDNDEDADYRGNLLKRGTRVKITKPGYEGLGNIDHYDRDNEMYVVSSDQNGSNILVKISDLTPLEESKNTPYVKPHIEKGSTKQSAWKASDRHGRVKYFGMDFKKAAERHAYKGQSLTEEVKNIMGISE